MPPIGVGGPRSPKTHSRALGSLLPLHMCIGQPDLVGPPFAKSGHLGNLGHQPEVPPPTIPAAAPVAVTVAATKDLPVISLAESFSRRLANRKVVWPAPLGEPRHRAMIGLCTAHRSPTPRNQGWLRLLAPSFSETQRLTSSSFSCP
jgi:hypothetical protein